MTRVVLGIETSNPSSWTAQSPVRPGVALAREQGGIVTLLGREELDPSRPHDDELLPAMARVVKQAGLAPRDLGMVAVSVGPGGFTSVRIAVAAAKMIAEATGAACVGVPTGAVAARGVTDRAGPVGVALASKGASFYLTVWAGRGTVQVGEACVIEAGGLARLAGRDGVGVRLLLADRFLPAAAREEAARLGIEVREPVLDPLACIECAIGQDGVDPAVLVPIYPREPEAVTKWRALHGEAPVRRGG